MNNSALIMIVVQPILIIVLNDNPMQTLSPSRSALLQSRLPTVRPLTNSSSLTDFQRFLLEQIEQLQRSSLCQRSTSNVVAVQNNYGALKESIINYYSQERAARKHKDTEQIAAEVTELKFAHEFMRNCIQEALKEFYTHFRTEMEGMSNEMSRVESENAQLRSKLMEMSKVNRQLLEENRELKRDVEEWQQAKERRKMKKQQRDVPSIEKIEEIIQRKLMREDLLTHMTPLKQFSMDSFLNRRMPSFQFATSHAQNKSISQTDKKFRTSTISEVKNNNQLSRMDQGEGIERENQPPRRRSKQKLKVMSIEL